MMTEIDIWRAAYLMVWWYGDTAQQESARRADELAADGNSAGPARSNPWAASRYSDITNCFN